MLKKLCALFVATLCFSLGSYALEPQNQNVYSAGSVHTEGLNNMCEEQAQMLKSLNLLSGTGDGFELYRTMTRGEAAVMLVRFMGAEEDALHGKYNHTFTDVPQWASSYVAWLTSNKITYGVSKTQYGAQQKITYNEFCTLLARYTVGEERDEHRIYREIENTQCNSNGFLRADAVGLLTRALNDSFVYTEGDINAPSVGQTLLDKGVFTAEQLRTASNVLPAYYYYAEDDYIIAVIARAEVARSEQPGMKLAQTDPAQPYIFAYRQELSRTLLYKLDCLTLEGAPVSEVARSEYTYASNIFGKDYLFCTSQDSHISSLVCYDGKTAETVIDRLVFGSANITGNDFQLGEGRMAVLSENKLYAVDQRGVQSRDATAGSSLSQLGKDIAVLARTADGTAYVDAVDLRTMKICDSYQVKLGYPTGNADISALIDGAAGRLSCKYDYYMGLAGLYREDGGRLNQLSQRPTLDLSFTRNSSSPHILCADLQSPLIGNMGTLMGTKIIELTPGFEKPLLDKWPDIYYGIESISAGGSVKFTLEGKQRGQMRWDYYTMYAQPDGKIGVVSVVINDDAIMTDTERRAEQKKIWNGLLLSFKNAGYDTVELIP